MGKKTGLYAGFGCMATFMVILLMPFLLIAGCEGVKQKTPPLSTGGPPVGGGCGLNTGAVPNGWGDAVAAAAQIAQMEGPILAAQLETESAWNPDAVGPMTNYGTAKGLAQFIDATFKIYGQGSVFDPLAAIAAQGKYMGDLKKQMEPLAQQTGVPVASLALAAYNAGPGAVEKYQGIPPYKETQDYVTKIHERAKKYVGQCTGAWTTPLPGGVLTSGYGPRWGTLHAGIDLATPGKGPGGTVVAATTMTVEWAGCKGDGYGCSITGRDPSTGYMFRYGHLVEGSILVTQGQTVATGTPIGTEGATGQVTGVHLHFEIYLPGAPVGAYASNGKPVDPLPILQTQGVQINANS